MTIRIGFRRPAPVARKVCKHCENRRALFRQEGILKWDPYYALCYKCYQRYFTRAQGETSTSSGSSRAQSMDEQASLLPAGASADPRRRTPALETGLMPAR